ncbi:MAG: hypothetical protein WAX04_10655, partial [Oscillospiraceae bacterium]
SFTMLILAAKAMQKSKETPIIFPVRDKDGKLRVKLDTCLGVRANSENKQNAWNFIKLSLSEEVMSENPYPSGAPVSKTVFQKEIKEIEQFEGGKEVLSQEFMDEYASLHDEVSMGFLFSPNLLIVDTIMKKYWHNEKSLEECIKEAQDQLEIYVSE